MKLLQFLIRTRLLFALLLAIGGLTAILVGLAFIYWPLTLLVGGIAAMLAGMFLINVTPLGRGPRQ